jgi:hypothetical protein
MTLAEPWQVPADGEWSVSIPIGVRPLDGPQPQPSMLAGSAQIV